MLNDQRMTITPPKPHANDAREAAFLALLATLKDERFISDWISGWRKQHSPSSEDYRLAQEIAYGSCRMAYALDHYAKQLSNKNRLKLKVKEKVLLRTALYQYFYMERIPLYAIVDETVKLAKKYCHPSILGFFNALLRRLGKEKAFLPRKDTPKEISIRYSYPQLLISELLKEYDLDTVKIILKAGNTPPTTTARIRSRGEKDPWTMITINDSTAIESLATSTDLYLQNITPVTLISSLCKQIKKTPKTILDLCAAPGGKTIAIHDAFPEAKIWANDPNEKRLQRLQENLKKYNIQATLTSIPAEEYPQEQLFDLIILDVPCSNTGVLNKRAEARWRYSESSLRQLENLQKSILKHASKLLTPQGELWYLTCSILKKENEEMVAFAQKHTHLQAIYTKKILPDLHGKDGGFATQLKKVDE